MKRLILAVVVWGLGCVVVHAESAEPPVPDAIERGLRRIEQGAASFARNRTCFSCHHQAMSILSLAAATQRGFAVDPGRLQQQVHITVENFKARLEELRAGEGLIGLSTVAVYALFALEGAGHAPDETTTALVQYLLVRQREDGGWPPRGQRPPSSGSVFTNTALALRGLRAYGTAGDVTASDDLRRQVERAFVRGATWLRSHTPADTEDKTFHLRGLVYAGAAPSDVEAARDRLRREQRGDGSWAQLPDREGDAYATGTVLTALRLAGLEPTHEAYRNGVRYLLRIQHASGAWIVQSRSRPVQPFFDNGDPGGRSQFISFAATAWAVLALLETRPPK